MLGGSSGVSVMVQFLVSRTLRPGGSSLGLCDGSGPSQGNSRASGSSLGLFDGSGPNQGSSQPGRI